VAELRQKSKKFTDLPNTTRKMVRALWNRFISIYNQSLCEEATQERCGSFGPTGPAKTCTMADGVCMDFLGVSRVKFHQSLPA